MVLLHCLEIFRLAGRISHVPANREGSDRGAGVRDKDLAVPLFSFTPNFSV